MDTINTSLNQLISEWEAKSRRAFFDAEIEANPMGKLLIEHGAMVYFNCAQSLKEVIRPQVPNVSVAPSGHQK